MAKVEVGTVLTIEPKKGKKKRRKPSQPLPNWKVILFNDDENEQIDVEAALIRALNFTPDDARKKVDEAHRSKASVLLVTHKELAEHKRDLLLEYRANLAQPLDVKMELDT